MLDKTWLKLMEIWPELSDLEQQAIVDAAKKLVEGESPDVGDSQRRLRTIIDKADDLTRCGSDDPAF